MIRHDKVQNVKELKNKVKVKFSKQKHGVKTNVLIEILFALVAESEEAR